MPCECCKITDDQFDDSTAQADLKYYKRNGPAKHTKILLEFLRSLSLKNASLLDVGGGVGIIYHELLNDTVNKVIHVDASSAYLATAEKETQHRGNAGKVEFIHADFTDVANELPKVDIVTLDRVVCCYPDFRALLKAAAGRSNRALAMAYPRETWYLKYSMPLANFMQWLTGNLFRIFVHPVEEMDSLLNKEGFKRISLKRLFVWEVALYQKIL